MNNADQLEREIARQVKRTKEIERIASVREAAKAELEAQASLRKQAKEHVQATLNKPTVKHQAQLPTQPEAQQTKLQQTEQPQLTFDDHMTKINELLVSLGGTPIVKAVTAVEVASTINTASTNNTTNTDNPDALSADEEQYQATIIQKMVALIQQRKKR